MSQNESTPPGSSPSTSETLAVTYGTTQLIPGMTLPKSLTESTPTISFTPSSPSQTYNLVLVDLSIPSRVVDQSLLVPKIQTPLTPGIEADRTTYLHYWYPNLKFKADGSMSTTTAPLAVYRGAKPPPGDISHNYVFYLFEQDENFQPPPAGHPFSPEKVNDGLYPRLCFSIGHLASEEGVGKLVAANYFLVQNTDAAPTT